MAKLPLKHRKWLRPRNRIVQQNPPDAISTTASGGFCYLLAYEAEESTWWRGRGQVARAGASPAPTVHERRSPFPCTEEITWVGLTLMSSNILTLLSGKSCSHHPQCDTFQIIQSFHILNYPLPLLLIYNYGSYQLVKACFELLPA